MCKTCGCVSEKPIQYKCDCKDCDCSVIEFDEGNMKNQEMNELVENQNDMSKYRLNKKKYDVKDLIELSINSLHKMMYRDSLFCFEKTCINGKLNGVSARYSLIAFLGLIKAINYEYKEAFNFNILKTDICTKLSKENLSTGDIGILLWLNSRLDRDTSNIDVFKRC